MSAFVGLTPDFYRFFWEISLQNERGFFEANRERYNTVVKAPMHALAAELTQAAQDVDAGFVTRPAAVVSRIRRDTRFSADKSLYRDHVFLSYKYQGMRTSECFVLYAEFLRESYGYGIGMLCPKPQFMEAIRGRILEKPAQFLSLVEAPAFQARFHLQGDAYKRPKHPDAPQALQPYLNKKRMSFCYSAEALENTMTSALVDEIREGFLLLKPVYRFVMGM